MTVIRPPAPGGSVVFCEDIRQEVTGKRLYVGVYLGEMTIHLPPPAQLAKLAFAINYSERPQEVGTPVTLKVLLPDGQGGDQEVLSVDLPVEEMKKMPPPEGVADEDQRISAVMVVELAPVVIKGPGFIKVRAVRGDDEVRLGSMRVRFSPPISFAAAF